MKDPKTRGKSWGLSSVHSPRGVSSKKPCKVICISLLALLVIAVLFGPGNVDDIHQSDGEELATARGYQKSSSSYNPSASIASKRDTAFFFSPKVVDLDDQRKKWWKQNPDVRAGRPKVLIMTGSQPTPCDNPLDTHMYLKSAKIKVHFSRMHDFQMHYNLIEENKDFVGSWNKLPAIRMQMLAHPEVEWFWWMDSELVLTDMHFQLPLDKYKGYNFVIYGDEHRVMELRDWQGLSAGNFIIRNCQWSLHFLDAWASMGSVQHRDEVGNFLSDFFPDRPQANPADEQSALVYLLATERSVWSSKTFLESDILLTGDWISVSRKLEELEEYGRGDRRWPVAALFTGCSRCSGAREGAWPMDECQREMERAMDFADNQVYRTYGYELRGLGIAELLPVPGHVVKDVVVASGGPVGDYAGFPIHKLPGPKVANWDAQRDTFFDNNPGVRRVNDHGLPKTMIVTGSSVGGCTHPVGGHGLLQALKNKVDYARFHDMPMFYGMVDFDKQLEYWWTKIPTIRVLMLAHPDVEWFWWCDGDAAVTDMVFTPPYHKFQGQNLVLYGDDELLEKKDWIAVNAGIYLVRNCQWTLDLFDAWATLGAKDVRFEAGLKLSEMLAGRYPGSGADDQSSILFIMLSEKDAEEKKWTPHIRLEREFTMSGYWKNIAPRYETMSKADKGTGNINWPWVTHFAGCQPCGDKKGNFDVAECRKQLQRAFDFADNQVLEQYGLVHSALGNPEVRRLKSYEKR